MILISRFENYATGPSQMRVLEHTWQVGSCSIQSWHNYGFRAIRRLEKRSVPWIDLFPI